MTLRIAVIPDPQNAVELDLLRRFPKLVQSAEKPAKNRTIRWTGTRAVKAVVSRTGVRAGLVRKRLKAYSAGAKSREAKLWLGGGAIPLGQLGTPKQAGDTAIYAGGKFATKNSKRRTFGGKMFKASGSLPAGYKFVRKGKERLPIYNTKKDLKYELMPEAQPVIDANFQRWVDKQFPIELERAIRMKMRNRGLL